MDQLVKQSKLGAGGMPLLVWKPNENFDLFRLPQYSLDHKVYILLIMKFYNLLPNHNSLQYCRLHLRLNMRVCVRARAHVFRVHVRARA